MRKYLLIHLILIGIFGYAQKVTTTPEFPTGDEEITFVFDVKQMTDPRAAGLLGLTSGVYLWSGAGTSANSDAFEYEPPGQTNFNAAFEPGAMTSLGDDKWEIKLTPRTYYDVPADKEIVKLGLLLKNASGSAQTEDIILELRLAGEFQLAINSPLLPAFFDQNETFDVEVATSEASDISISLDGQEIASATNVTTLTQSVTADVPGDHIVAVIATKGTETLEKQFSYLVREPSVDLPLPAGIIRGINYDPADDTRATLCLQAPNKSNVYVVGDFNDWVPKATYQMNKDGEYFWIELSNLTPGTEYAFQYLVDESIYIADPYCDKILHPDDAGIPEEVYPNLKTFPVKARNDIGFYNTVSVLETGQTAFNWSDDGFQRPAKSDLIIYELLIRDFFGTGEQSYSNLIDTLSYIKSLGVNTIELMPITEFGSNNSWGYNPTFMFASDKAYGPKNELKAFIDAAHGLGMAVILDMVLNQQEQPSPLILLDYNTSTSQVTADNPYFNVSATHPFNVFYDMNHESPYTQSFVDTVNHYWIDQFHFDGYRFDLSKGFTQRNSGNNVGAWSSYDATRIAILKRMANAIWSFDPDAYVILEHFGESAEEKELADYGMMLWGNMHEAYKENLLGFEGTKTNFTGVYHQTRNWIKPHLIGYMESHDEERQTVEIQKFGNSNSAYSARTTAVERLRAGFANLLMIPGPKMIWQFGELAYDISIDYPCNEDDDPENDGKCRTNRKQTPWDDTENNNLYGKQSRQILRQYVSEMNRLRNTYPSLFARGNAVFSGNNSLLKQIRLETNASSANPTSPTQMSAVIVSNFDVVERNADVSFPFAGTWYNYFDGTELSLTGTTTTLTLRQGEFHIYTNYPLETPELILNAEAIASGKIVTYPNPATAYITVSTELDPLYYFMYDLQGRELSRGKFTNDQTTIDLSSYNNGIILLEVITRSGARFMDKIIKQ